MGRITEALKPFEVKHKQAQYAAQGTTGWANRDIYPVIPEHWTYSSWAYFVYWATAGICISSYTLGSSMIGIGLTAGQAVGGVLLATGLSSLLSYFTGAMGRIHRVGFFMNCRTTFGLWGANFMIVLNVFGSIIYFGVQSYYGGQAVVVILNSIFPSFLNLPNTLPESAFITTQALIGFLLYFVFYVPCIFIPAWQIHKWLYPNFVVTCAAFAGILGYFIHANGGAGSLLSTLSSAVEITETDRAFAMLSSISSIGGAYTGGTVRVSDWTRFAKTRRAPIVPIIIAMPLTVTLGALVGVLVTSSAYDIYGEVLWNPLILLQHLQAVSYTPACRAGTFFAGCGLLSSQIFENITQNGFTNGMDIAGLMPRYFDMRRGLMLICVLGILIQPWRMLTQAVTFLTVLSAFGVFWAPMTGIMIADFWIIRKRKLIMADLYKEGGIYWYSHGWNWRAFAAFFIAIAPSMPGLVATVGGYTLSNGWFRIYYLAYFVGMAIGFVLYLIICHFFPPEGLGIQEDLDAGDVIEGEQGMQETSGGEEGKGAWVSDTSVPAV
ncbi:NCS1 family nucleobase:cation symporter-1 [Thozetella sp. PMI_491]|nr:NCS1 family nucleobase:cation symporter-1 [Thozetella sp. PMI_491]